MIAYIITCNPSGQKYVGITTKATPDKRWKQHVYDTNRTRMDDRLLFRAIRKYGVSAFSIEHVASARTWSDLCELETALILQHGTFWADGRGYNMTLGGDGVPGLRQTEEHKAKIAQANRGKIRTEQTRAKLRLAGLGKRLPPEVRAKMSAVRMGRKLTPNHIAKLKGRKLTPNQISNLTAARRVVPTVFTPEALAKMSAAHLAKTASEETRAKMSAAQLGKKHSEDAKAKMSASARSRGSISPETREKMKASHLGKSKGPMSPEVRAKISLGRRRGIIKVAEEIAA